MARFGRGTETVDVEDHERQRALYRDGWQRVRGDEVAFDESEPRDLELERTLRENPDDEAAWLVLADLLLQHGHPRGPLIARDNKKHLREARDVLVGPLRTRIGLEWRRGFFHRARIYVRENLEDALFDLLRHPSARFLRELVIDLPRRPALDLRLLVDMLAHHAPAPPLTRLEISHNYSMEQLPVLGGINKLCVAYPKLEYLAFEGDPGDTTDLAFPCARHFTLTTKLLERRTLTDIAAAPWPQLEFIRLWFGESSPCTFDDFAPLLDNVPRLTYLSVLESGFASDIIRAVAASPLAKQIEAFDMPERIDADAAALVRPEVFPRLAFVET